RAWMARCLAERGEFASAIALAEDAVHIAETLDHAFTMGEVCGGGGSTYLPQGRIGRAATILPQGYSVGEPAGSVFATSWLAALLAHAQTLAGRAAEAIPLLEQAIARAEAANIRAQQGLLKAYLGEAYLEAGRCRDAFTTTEAALAQAREQGERGD